MTAVLIGLVVALVASVSQSGGFLCQEVGAAQRPPVTPRHPLRTLRAMVGSRWWLAGFALGSIGFLLHLTALALAPISLVQAFIAGGLAFAVPLAAGVFHHRLTASERRSVFMMAAALAVLALGIGDSSGHLSFDSTALAIY